MTKAQEDAALASTHIAQAKMNSWIAFCVSKVTGFTGLGVGGIEWLDPSLLPQSMHQINHPGVALGVGIALLCGKETIKLIKPLIAAIG